MAMNLGRWITPSEAGEIASRFRAAAEQIRLVTGSVSQTGSRLDESWSGNAKNVFDSHFNSLPGEITAYADMLDQMAHTISNIQVWVHNGEN